MLKILITAALLFLLPQTFAQASYKDALLLTRSGQWVKAIRAFQELSDEGHAPSRFSLGIIYHLGRGVHMDLEKAYGYYKLAALQKHLPSINNLGMMYLNGEYVNQHRETAYRLFKMASSEHAQAKDNIGKCYENGWGTDIDAALAQRFYQESGEAGYRLGYFHLATLHEKGRAGAPINVKESIKWYAAAGDDDYVKGYHRIGQIYEEGLGVDKDIKEAIVWYNKAALKNYPASLRKLRELDG